VRTALVLGGGGITGIAWELGMVAGLADAGIDLRSVDLVVGTSAGSIVGAQLTSDAPLERLYADQLIEPSPEEVNARMGLGILFQFVLAAAWPRDPLRARARMGRKALAARPASGRNPREAIAEGLLLDDWPEKALKVTAVDADSGEFKVFDRESRVPLADAVAASCAVPLVWPPVAIDGHRYMDGGVRSITNADLAAGCERVVVIAPVVVAMRRSTRIDVQLARLGPGVRSIVVSPDRAARKAIGRQVLSPERRPAAARAGRAQAALVAARVREVLTP